MSKLRDKIHASIINPPPAFRKSIITHDNVYLHSINALACYKRPSLFQKLRCMFHMLVSDA